MFKIIKTIFNRIFRNPDPLTVFFILGAVLAIVFSAFRALHVAMNWGHVSGTPGFMKLFLIGFHVDTIIVSYFLAIPVISLLLYPQAIQKFRRSFVIYSCLIFGLSVFLECATVPFIEEYSLRPNRIFIEYLKDYREVFGTIFRANLVHLIAGVLTTVVLTYLFCRYSARLLKKQVPLSKRVRTIVLPVLLAVLFFGARGTGPWEELPADLGISAFSNDHLTNQMALNSTYSLMWAVYVMKFEKNPAGVYLAKMPPEEIYARVKKVSGIPESEFYSKDIPLLHRQRPKALLKNPRNLVIILEESLGAEFVGSLGGLSLTPNLDNLSKEGLFFTRLYSTGIRSVNGIEAVISGFLPTPGKGVIKLGLSQHNFFTAAELLRRHGYVTSFVYGGNSNFDTMRGFAIGNGFEEIIDRKDFINPVFVATWGVSDEDLFTKANEWLRSQNKPAFTLIFTTSNHGPFEFPDGRIELYDKQKATVHNTIKYADYSLGYFFKLARKELYYKNTVFLIVADHNWRNFGSNLVPIDKMRIPGLIIGPSVKPGTFDRAASQIDLLPTLLPLLGIEMSHPLIGHDLLSVSGNFSGAAILQFGDNNAYMVGDRVVVTMPHKTQREFRFINNKFIPEQLDPELAKDALAHALLPGLLYLSRNYHL